MRSILLRYPAVTAPVKAGLRLADRCHSLPFDSGCACAQDGAFRVGLQENDKSEFTAGVFVVNFFQLCMMAKRGEEVVLWHWQIRSAEQGLSCHILKMGPFGSVDRCTGRTFGRCLSSRFALCHPPAHTAQLADLSAACGRLTVGGHLYTFPPAQQPGNQLNY